MQSSNPYGHPAWQLVLLLHIIDELSQLGLKEAKCLGHTGFTHLSQNLNPGLSLNNNNNEPRLLWISGLSVSLKTKRTLV